MLATWRTFSIATDPREVAVSTGPGFIPVERETESIEIGMVQPFTLLVTGDWSATLVPLPVHLPLSGPVDVLLDGCTGVHLATTNWAKFHQHTSPLA